jgi:transcriptional regulator with XRE-family HTH domain
MTLQNLLDKKFMTQAEFAKVMAGKGAKVSNATVSLWVSGKRMPKRAHIRVMSEIFDVPALELEAALKANTTSDAQEA